MDILFIHPNFPAQFKSIAPALVKEGHRVIGMREKHNRKPLEDGVELAFYTLEEHTLPANVQWTNPYVEKFALGKTVYNASLKLKQQGFNPKVIILQAIRGGGGGLFIKDVWPDAKFGLSCEFYTNPQLFDRFDPEFYKNRSQNLLTLRLCNMFLDMNCRLADGLIVSTEYQKSTFPEAFSSAMFVNHEGIDTDILIPFKEASLTLDLMGIVYGDEVITFINNNLEPARGFPTFMRNLPELLRRRPKVHVVIIGGTKPGYYFAPQDGRTWKEILIEEIRPEISDNDWKRVHFTGRVSYKDYITILQLSAVHVYYTYPFVLSWSMLEAMSMECVLIGSDTAPVQEVITHNETGMLLDFFDYKLLTNTICELLDDPDKRKTLGKNAREYVKKHYDLKTVCLPAWIKWIYDLASPPPKVKISVSPPKIRNRVK